MDEPRERGGLPLWVLAASVSLAWAGCLAFLARFPLVFDPGSRWLDQCLEWAAGVCVAVAVLLPACWLARAGLRRRA